MNKLVLILLLAFSVTVNAQNLAKKPNIVYILADDMGIGDVSGLNPDAKVSTPNIDNLINNGMTFTDAHTTSSVCTPSRYSIMTGEYAWRTQLKGRVLDGYSKALIKDSKDTAPKLLQRNGYKTAMIGKWHLCWNWVIEDEANLEMNPKNPYQYNKDISTKVDYSKPFSGGPTDCGFDYFFGLNASLDFPPYVYSENNKLITIPTKTMKPDGKDKNFPGGRKKDLVGGQKLKRKGDKAPDFLAEQVMLDLTKKSVDYISNYKENKPFFLYIPLTAPHTPVYPRDEFIGKSKAGIYGDFIQELDWTVGQIVSALKEKGIEDNTIIIFTADNGASKSSFPKEFESKYQHKPSAHLKGRKASLSQGGHTVPFIVQWKNEVKPNSKNNTTISLGDLYATCADLLNAETDKNQGVDSYSILSLLEGKDNYRRKVSVYTDFAGRFSIRKGDWKMDLNKFDKKNSLINIKVDPSETNNLFQNEAYADKKKELTSTLDEIILNGRSTAGESLENKGPKIWKELFWMKNKKK
jgi:arylsulfatase A